MVCQSNPDNATESSIEYRQHLTLGRASYLDAGKIANELQDSSLPKPTFRLYFSIIICLLGTFQFGWLTTQFNASEFHDADDCARDFVKKGTCVVFPGHSNLEWVLTINFWIIGGAIGALCSGTPSNIFGRKKTIMYNAILMIIGSALQTFSHEIWLLILGRFISGLVSGIAVTVSGVYISELAPPNQRGTLGSGVQLSIVVGILCVTIAIFGLSTASTWRYLVSFPIVFGALQLSMYPWILRSPRWLISKNRHEEAYEELKRIYGQEADISVVMDELNCNLDIEVMSTTKKVQVDPQDERSPLATLLRHQYVKQLIIAVGLCVLQQLSGINAVFYYSSDIFKNAGISNTKVGTVIIATVNVLATIVSLVLMDRAGRRKLLLVGTAGMFISAIGMTFSLVLNSSLLSVIFTGMYVSFFEFGLGPIPWLIAAEIFPEEVRAHAGSVAAFFNWLANLTVGLSYPYIAMGLGPYGFTPFIVVLAAGVVFIYIMVPETKNKTLEQIQRDLCASMENDS